MKATITTTNATEITKRNPAFLLMISSIYFIMDRMVPFISYPRFLNMIKRSKMNQKKCRLNKEDYERTCKTEIEIIPNGIAGPFIKLDDLDLLKSEIYLYEPRIRKNEKGEIEEIIPKKVNYTELNEDECKKITKIKIIMNKFFKYFDYLFYGCYSGFSVKIKSIAPICCSLKNFLCSSAYQKVDLRQFNTKNVTDMNQMFESSLLNEIDLSCLNTSQVYNMDRMFYGCNYLKNINLNNIDTSKVVSMHGMFSGCYLLEKLDLSSFNTSKVTDMSQMFDGCSGLKGEFDLSNFDTSKVRNMNTMFSECENLRKINVSNFNTSKVNDMGCMFYCCENLEEVDVSNFDTSNVENFNCMFYSCHHLNFLDLSGFVIKKDAKNWGSTKELGNHTIVKYPKEN